MKFFPLLVLASAAAGIARGSPFGLGGLGGDTGGGDKGGDKLGGGAFPFVTTETVTTTITTDSFCYTTDKKLLGPKTKACQKRRAIETTSIMGMRAAKELAHAISPSPSQAKRKGDEADLGLAAGQSENPREGRFCCYAVTKTETSTIYLITATTTVTFKCTPTSSILNLCTGGDKKKGLGDKLSLDALTGLKDHGKRK